MFIFCNLPPLRRCPGGGGLKNLDLQNQSIIHLVRLFKLLCNAFRSYVRYCSEFYHNNVVRWLRQTTEMKQVLLDLWFKYPPRNNIMSLYFPSFFHVLMFNWRDISTLSMNILVYCFAFFKLS